MVKIRSTNSREKAKKKLSRRTKSEKVTGGGVPNENVQMDDLTAKGM